MSDDPRKPLIPLTGWERIRRLQELGLDENMLPDFLSKEEKDAINREGRMAEETKPLIPEKLANIAGIIGGLLSLAATAAASISGFPAWVAFSLSALAAVALFLAGKALPALKLSDKPIVPVIAVPFLKTAAIACGTLASQFPAGAIQGVLLLAASILYGLAGLVAPQEKA